MPATFLDKLDATGPKKLLAIDGGGIRGLIAIEYLARIEALLRERSGRSDLVLGDYFDYVAGTSTGGILATLVALGMPVDRMREFYVGKAREMFAPATFLKRFQNRYVAARLAATIRDVLGDMTLGSEDLRTLLLLVMRNATTDSPWPVSNNPRAMYNDRSLANCNLQVPLWQLVRASTAAPVYFPPEEIDFGDERFLFVDGAVTMYNNPSFLLFCMATLEPYRLQWPVGEDRLLLVSVGTGLSRKSDANLKATQMNLIYNAARIPSALIYSALVEQDRLCRIFGRMRAGGPPTIDSEIGALAAATGGLVSPKLFTYMRYNLLLSSAELASLGLAEIAESEVQPLDRVDKLDELRRVGAASAARLVAAEHFEGFV
jgi:hypothetical protein